MAIIDEEERQLTMKIVYCGPPLAGKTTNLTKLFDLVRADSKGRLMTLEGQGERTIFFDLLPLFFQVSGLAIRIKVYTVPGQPAHQMTRRAVLRGADGVAFIADSRAEQAEQNRYAFRELTENLAQGAERPHPIAMVTQYNKRDESEPLAMEPFASEPVEGASAESGVGVVSTFLRVARATWAATEAHAHLEERFGVSEAEFTEALARHLEPAP